MKSFISMIFLKILFDLNQSKNIVRIFSSRTVQNVYQYYYQSNQMRDELIEQDFHWNTHFSFDETYANHSTKRNSTETDSFSLRCSSLFLSAFNSTCTTIEITNNDVRYEEFSLMSEPFFSFFPHQMRSIAFNMNNDTQTEWFLRRFCSILSGFFRIENPQLISWSKIPSEMNCFQEDPIQDFFLWKTKHQSMFISSYLTLEINHFNQHSIHIPYFLRRKLVHSCIW